MKEDFKKWLCEKAEDKKNIKYFNSDILEPDDWIALLTKAMWAINKEGVYAIELHQFGIEVFETATPTDEMGWWYKSFNSEQDTLIEALEYIWEQTK